MIVYIRLNEEYGIVAYKCFLEYHQELGSPISQAGVWKNMANPDSTQLIACYLCNGWQLEK